jgi:hypothetical protein
MGGEQFFIPIPAFIAKRKDLTATAKLVFGSIFMRSAGRGKTETRVPADWITEDWGLDRTTITAGIQQLINIKALLVRRTQKGNVYQVRLDPIDEADSDDGNSSIGKVQCGKIQNPNDGNSIIGMMENPKCINTYTGTKTESKTEKQRACPPGGLEPFESEPARETLPNLKPPVLLISDRAKQLATELGQESWLNAQVAGGTPGDDPVLLETLSRVAARSKKTREKYSGSYLTSVFVALDAVRDRFEGQQQAKLTGEWPVHLWSDDYRGWTCSEERLAWERKKIGVAYKRGPKMEAAK